MTPQEAFESTSPDLNLQWGPVRVLQDKPEILTAIRHEEAHELIHLSVGKDVLEIGGAHGYSSIIMALAGAKKIVSIDDHNGYTQLGDTLGIMTNNLVIFGVTDKVEIMACDSSQGMLGLLETGWDFDFIFLDGGEKYEQLCVDITLAMALIAFRNGTLAIHDYGHEVYGEKKKAVDRYFPQGPDKLVHSLFIKHFP